MLDPSSCAFALWLLLVSGVPLHIGAAVYDTSLAVGIDPSILGGVLAYEHPGATAENFLPPYKVSSGGCEGLFQLDSMWYSWAQDEHGVFVTDPSIDWQGSLLVAVHVVVYFNERHAKHTHADHPWEAHWVGSESCRSDWDSGDTPECQEGAQRLARRILGASAWRVMLPLAVAFL